MRPAMPQPANVLQLRPERGAGEYDLLEGATRRGELTTGRAAHRLDTPQMRKVLHQLLSWYYFERDRQAANRLEMSIDHDFYDNLQWDEEDAEILKARGQMPLVYNEVAPMADWIIGTERRNRVDWKVLPRSEDDVDAADVKTKVLKYVADVNRSAFARSRAFADAVKGGIGWVDAGVRDDPTADILYDRYENWRNVLWDSSGSEELDVNDGRYVFRWRHVDEDIGSLMFPDREDRIRVAAEDHAYHIDPMIDDVEWPARTLGSEAVRGGLMSPLSSGFGDGAERRRVKIIECQFRMPAKTKMVSSGPMKGAFFDPSDRALVHALNQRGGSIIDKVTMRTHVAVFTESDLLALGPSIYRHNKFSLTPVWCYRRSRDRLPYGAIRRVRDVQQDLNKRASKALWHVNSNQAVVDAGAVDDLEELREELQMPDGLIVKKAGKQLEIRRDPDAATGQMQIMAMDQQSIQRTGGVTDENRGLRTNATSGKAIEARQLQGSVVTTEPFDNLRYMVQCHGEKQLALVEQFYTEEKVVRLTGARGAIEWVKINQPELQADGTVRFLNDIASSMADFVVSDQDYAGTLRQVMFDSLARMAERQTVPEFALRMMRIAFEYSDLPNKDEIVTDLRRLTGEQDPNKKLTPEEADQQEQQMRMQAEAMEVQRQTALATLAEQQAKVREINARADQLEAQAEKYRAEATDAGRDTGMPEAQLNEIMQVREQLAAEIERLSGELQKAQNDAVKTQLQLVDKGVSIRTEADTRLEVARLDRDARERIAEIQRVSDDKLQAVLDRVEAMAKKQEERIAKVDTDAKESVKRAKTEAREQLKAATTPPPAAAPAPTPSPAAPAIAPVAAAVPTPPDPAPPVAREFIPTKNAKGQVTGGVIKRSDGIEETMTVRYVADEIVGVSIKPKSRARSKK